MAPIGDLERLRQMAATLPKGTPLFVEGELVYEQYPRKVQATIGQKTIEVEVQTKVAKIKVQRLIRLEFAGDIEVSELAGDAQ